MKRIPIIITLALAALAATFLVAQETQQRVAFPAGSGVVPCPHTVSTVLNGASGPPTPDQADLGPLYANVTASQWNQTSQDKHFAHTFKFAKDCCLMTTGVLTVKVKALSGGGPNSSTAANDGFHIYSNGSAVAVLSQQPWVNTGVTAGTIATLTYNIPASVLATGRVTFYAQDDSAVLSADLTLRGCCIR